jgi:hypothetical protein
MRNAMMEADQTVKASNGIGPTPSMTVDNFRATDGPSRESVPSSSRNSGRADAANATDLLRLQKSRATS